jgi:hypothetical protein
MAVSPQGQPGHVHECPDCQPEPEPVAPFLLLGLGGMLIFFSLAFWIVAFVAEPGMLFLALGMTIIGLVMMAFGWRILVKRKQERKSRHESAFVKAKCEYCGGQNQPGENKCQFCGAPLF